MASVLPLREIERMDPQPNVVPTETVLKGFHTEHLQALRNSTTGNSLQGKSTDGGVLRCGRP